MRKVFDRAKRVSGTPAFARLCRVAPSVPAEEVAAMLREGEGYPIMLRGDRHAPDLLNLPGE